MRIARTGHRAMQAPQPSQASLSRNGDEPLDPERTNRSAPRSHCSAQIWHTTPWLARQLDSITAHNSHGARSPRFSASVGQWSTQAPQNVQLATEKSGRGNPPSPGLNNPVGHSSLQSPQRLQRSKNDSAAHGGRSGGGASRNRPRKKCRRLMTWDTCTTVTFLLGIARPIY